MYMNAFLIYKNQLGNKFIFNPFIDDFDHGVKMITQLQEGGHVVQLVGFCQDKNLVRRHQTNFKFRVFK